MHNTLSENAALSDERVQSTDAVCDAPVAGEIEGARIDTTTPTQTHYNLLISRSDLLGQFARYAVMQSPYTAPENLVQAITEFSDALDFKPEISIGAFQIRTFTSLRTLRVLVRQTFEKVPTILAWNERKNGNQSPFGFSSRFDGPSDPDDDFIDLDALANNIAREAWRDAERERVWNKSVADAPAP